MIIGNILSFFAALFMVASCVVKRKQAVFFCQFLECALLAVASVFFGSLAGMTTLVLSAVRNLVVAKGRYTKPVMVAFVILTIVAGLLANTRGLVGLLPVLATVEYTICGEANVRDAGAKALRTNIFKKPAPCLEELLRGMGPVPYEVMLPLYMHRIMQSAAPGDTKRPDTAGYPLGWAAAPARRCW